MARIPDPFDAPRVSAYRAKRLRQAQEQQQLEQMEEPPTPPRELEDPYSPTASGSSTVGNIVSSTYGLDPQELSRINAEVDALLGHWINAGIPTLSVAVTRITETLRLSATEIPNMPDGPATLDNVHALTSMGLKMRKAGSELHDSGKRRLWKIAEYRCKVMWTPTGARFQFFKSPKTYRKVNYDLLERKFPEVYDEVVSVVRVDALTPPTIEI